MNYSKLLFYFFTLFVFGAHAQQTEERYVSNVTPNNTLTNPASYAHFDHYKRAKEKGALVYGRDYIFEGISTSDVTQQLIDEVDPYRYLNQFRNHEKVFVDLTEQGLTMILFPIKTVKINQLNENE